MPRALAFLLIVGWAVLWSAIAMSAADTLYSSDTPPARFQGEGMAVVLYLDPERLQATCQRIFGQPPPAGMRFLGCSYLGDGWTWTTVLPNPCAVAAAEPFAQIACHEKGHTLGWSAMHER